MQPVIEHAWQLTPAEGVALQNTLRQRVERVDRLPVIRYVAVVVLAVQTGRWDTKAVVESIRQVAQTRASPAGPADEPEMQRILEMLRELGVTFLGVEGDHLSYAVRGEEREPVRCKQLTEMLAEGWQTPGISR